MTNLPPPPNAPDFFPLGTSGGAAAGSLPAQPGAQSALTNSGTVNAPKEKLLPKRARPPKKPMDDDDDEDEEPAPKKARKNPKPKDEDEDEDDEDEDDEDDEDEEMQQFEVTVEWPAQSVEVDSDDNTHYETVKLNGADYRVGEVVSLWPEDWKTQKDGPIGEIISLVTDGTENYVELKWYYNVAETSIRGLKRKQHNPRELFLSDHIEEQALEAIARKVTMKKISDIPNLDEYCKGDGNYFYTRKWDHETHEFEDL
jgi:hypothetical protein